jgi:hypothetical protein
MEDWLTLQNAIAVAALALLLYWGAQQIPKKQEPDDEWDKNQW